MLHKCYCLIGIHSTHREPGEIISPDFMDREIESYSRFAGSNRWLRHRSVFPLFGLELHLISINKTLRRIRFFNS